MKEVDNLAIKGELTTSFYNFLKNYSNKSDKTSFSPKELKNEIGCKFRKFAGYQQHDSQEFLRLFIEEIGKELNRVKITPPYRELETKNLSKESQNENFHDFFIKRENSIVIETFYGQTCNTFKCTCGLESYSFEKFLDVPLLISNKSSLISYL